MGYWRMPRSAVGRVIRQRRKKDEVEKVEVISIRVIGTPINM